MKTATVTWITYNNYGTALQAYALQKYLEKIGVDNVIISDYSIIHSTERPPENSVKMRGRETLVQYLLHPMRLIFKVLYGIENWYKKCTHLPYAQSQQLFEKFKQDELKILYGMKREDMPKLNNQFDVFICGSDQIWSVLDYNFNGYFFLDFVTKKKISYAASIGAEKISEQRANQIRTYLSNFSAISIREKQSSVYLSQLLDRPVEWVADPTLLHDAAFWTKFSKGARSPRGKYLLCYFLGKKSWYFDYAHALAKHLRLKVVLIPSWYQFAEHKSVCRHGVGPKEFVAMFRDASYVLTDSYHGSIFAMQFKKEFLHLKRFADDDPICQNIRVNSLFSMVELKDWIIAEKEFEPEDIRRISYDNVSDLLRNFREKSQTYLNENILVSE